MRFLLIAFLIYLPQLLFAENQKIDLSGRWQFKLDSLDVGIKKGWYEQSFDDCIDLPGALQNQGYGNDITTETPWVLGGAYRSGAWYTHPMYEPFRKKENLRYPINFQPKKHYVGVAWYKKEIFIPEKSKDQKVLLSFERVHWQSTLWVDNQLVDSCNSLLAPHIYDISKFVQPGKKQTITLRIDNSQIINIGPNAHSWGDQTMTAWNGVIGEMSLIVKDALHMEDMQIYTDLKTKEAKLIFELENLTDEPIQTTLSWSINSYNTDIKQKIVPRPFDVIVKPGLQRFSYTVDLTDDVLLWDEYHPNLYKLETSLKSDKYEQHYSDVFGVREIKTKDNRFLLNGREIYLRGTLMCGTFPMTGYVSMDYLTLKKILTLYKHYGLNHVRFHSWTPPKAAFQAADELGLYLYTETDAWIRISTPEQKDFLMQEGDLSLKYYGNHASFVMMGIGNEMMAEHSITNALLEEWKKDNRRLYTGLANSIPSITPSVEFAVTKEVRSNIGWPPRPEYSFFYRNKPSTDFVFDNPIKYSVPLITHEAGQHVSYPSLDQMGKFTGSQLAGYIDIARSQLRERGMLEQWPEFVKASGKLQTLFYKYELETYLRMPRHSGYELLQLEDFPGQGAALWGVLDYFYDNKGYITPEEFRRFCSQQVLLAKFSKFTWTAGEEFKADILYSNWSEGDLFNRSIRCTLTDEYGKVHFEKIFSPELIKRGDAVEIGKVSKQLENIPVPCKLTLNVYEMDSDIQNSWDIWVYPETIKTENAQNIPIVTSWNQEVEERVKAGETVVLQLNKTQIRGELPPSFLPIYWTQTDKLGNSQTMGILCNPKHPLFKKFPTDQYTNWHWYELLNNAYPLIFDEFQMQNAWDKSFRPLIQLIDGWKTNRKVGVLAEAKMGKGRIVITSMDLTSNLETRIVARQFKYSLLNYMNSSAFNPEYEIRGEQVQALLSDGKLTGNNKLIKNIHFENIKSTDSWQTLVDNNKQTEWKGKILAKNKETAIIIELNKTEGVGGIIYYPISDTQSGRILDYQLFISDDGKNWEIPLVKDKFSDSSIAQNIDLLYFHAAKYIKLEILSTTNSEKLGIAELNLMVE